MTFYVFRRTTAKRVSVKPMQGSISEEVRIFNNFDEEKRENLASFKKILATF